MEPVFDPRFEGTRQQTFESVRIQDTIVMRPMVGLSDEGGIVVILDSFRPPDFARLVGQPARFPASADPLAPHLIRAVRDHGITISFFLERLSKAEVPIGSRIEFPSVESVDEAPMAR